MYTYAHLNKHVCINKPGTLVKNTQNLQASDNGGIPIAYDVWNRETDRFIIRKYNVPFLNGQD